jgi:hypothetical protein
MDEDDFDYSAYKAEDIEATMAAGAMLPEGYYKSAVESAKPTTSKGDKPGWEITYKVTDGPLKGATITDTLWKHDPTKPKSVAKMLIWKSRLGLIAKNANGNYEPVKGKKDFMDCLDHPVIIHVRHEEYLREKDGTKGVSAKLDFNGLHAIDDAKALALVGVPVPTKEEKEAAKETKAADKSKKEPAKKKLNTSDL